jgi:hypothetical protein
LHIECTRHLHEATSYVAAAEAAIQAVLAAAVQQRQQVQLQLLSLLGSCVKAMASDWQRRSWKWVTSGCCLAAELSCHIASLEHDVQQAQADCLAAQAVIRMGDWRQIKRQLAPDMEELLQQALQHPCGWRLARLADKEHGALQAAAAIAEQLLSAHQPEHGLLEEASAHSIMLAAMMAGMQTTNGAVQDSSLPSSSSSSSQTTQHDGGKEAAAASSSSSSGALSQAQVEVQLACLSVVTRALRLYGAVIDAALGNPCLHKAATATERAAGAAALTQQLELAKDYGLLAPLPREVQHQLDKNNKQYLSSQKGASAVIGALLHGVYGELTSVETCVENFESQLEELAGQMQLPQQVVQQLEQHTSELTRPLDEALQMWVNLDPRSNSSYDESDGESASGSSTEEDPREV